MIARILFLASLSSFAPAEETIPPLQLRERMTPWGTVVERSGFYQKDGREVEHGIQESYSADGVIWRRGGNAHGELDGPYVLFYEGIGRKMTEMSYAAGVEQGECRTWAPDGSLLFEGTLKNGRNWNGWFEQESTSGSGVFHRKEESWKIAEWRDGKKIPKSGKTVKTSWRTWTPGRLPDPKMFIRWNWPTFQTESTYRYQERMPDYADVPFLIDCYEKKGEGYEMASDQLTALTRMQFGDPWLQTDAERIAATAKWREWWKDVGTKLPKERNERGVRDLESWNLAQRGRNLRIPEEPQLIPGTYELKVHFRSGDYDAVTSETLTIQRGRDEAGLVRTFSTLRDGPMKEERWLPFTVEDADRVLRALGYLIDRPWLLNDEAEIEKRYWAAEKADSGSEPQGMWCDEKLKGRESYGRPYYPSVDFELHDGGGKIWWNADPDHWYGANPDRFNRSHQPVPGTVFPFLSALYPETSRWNKSGTPGWKTR